MNIKVKLALDVVGAKLKEEEKRKAHSNPIR